MNLPRILVHIRIEGGSFLCLEVSYNTDDALLCMTMAPIVDFLHVVSGSISELA